MHSTFEEERISQAQTIDMLRQSLADKTADLQDAKSTVDVKEAQAEEALAKLQR